MKNLKKVKQRQQVFFTLLVHCIWRKIVYVIPFLIQIFAFMLFSNAVWKHQCLYGYALVL